MNTKILVLLLGGAATVSGLLSAQTAPTILPGEQQPAASDPAPAREPALAQRPDSRPQPSGEPRRVTIPAGLLISVRLAEPLSTNHNFQGDVFALWLDQPMVVNGFVVAARGARAYGRIVEMHKAGRVKGVSTMTLELTKIYGTDGQKIDIHTADFVRKGRTTHGADAANIAGTTILGAAIGAIAGGGVGAAIGAGAGGAAGTGATLLTRGRPTGLAVETRLTFRLQDSVTITQRLR